MTNVIPVDFRRSRSTDRVIAALERLKRAMEADAEQTERWGVDRAELLDQLSAAMARDYQRTMKGKRDE